MKLFSVALVLVVPLIAGCDRGSLNPVAPSAHNTPSEYQLRQIFGTNWPGPWGGYEVDLNDFGKGVLKAEVGSVPGPPDAYTEIAIMENRPGSDHCDLSWNDIHSGYKCWVIVVRNSNMEVDPKSIELEVNGLDGNKFVGFRSNKEVSVSGWIKFYGVLK